MFHYFLRVLKNKITQYYNIFMVSCSSIAMGLYLHLHRDFFKEYTFIYFLGEHSEIAFFISLVSMLLGGFLLISIFFGRKRIIRIITSGLAGFWLGVAAVFIAAKPPGSYWIFALLAFFVLIGNIKREVDANE